jgi:hypothetical protein
MRVIGVLVFLGLSLIFTVSAVEATVVKVDPASQTVTPGESFSVNVRVEDVTYMGAHGASLNFEPSAMSVTSVIEGDFLKTAGATLPLTNIDNTAGTATFCYSLMTPGVGVDGSGVLATINFNINPAAEDVYNLDLTNVELFNGAGDEITGASIINGLVTIEPEPTATPTPTPQKPSNGDGGSGNSDVPDTTPTPTTTPSLVPTSSPTPTPTSTPTVTSTPAGAAVVKAYPTTQNVTAGDSFSIDVRVESVTNMSAAQTCLNFEPGAIQATGIVEGDFLNSVAGGGGTLPIELMDNATGTVTFAYTLKKEGFCASGSGVLATINFSTNPAAEGVFNLVLTDVMLLNAEGDEITVGEVSAGEVKIQPVPSPRSGTGMIVAISILAIALAISTAMRKRRKRRLG